MGIDQHGIDDLTAGGTTELQGPIVDETGTVYDGLSALTGSSGVYWEPFAATADGSGTYTFEHGYQKTPEFVVPKGVTRPADARPVATADDTTVTIDLVTGQPEGRSLQWVCEFYGENAYINDFEAYDGSGEGYRGRGTTWQPSADRSVAGSQSVMLPAGNDNADMIRNATDLGEQTIEAGNRYSYWYYTDSVNTICLTIFAEPGTDFNSGINCYRLDIESSRSLYSCYVDGRFNPNGDLGLSNFNGNETEGSWTEVVVDLTEWPDATMILRDATGSEYHTHTETIGNSGPQRSSGDYGIGNDSSSDAPLYIDAIGEVSN